MKPVCSVRKVGDRIITTYSASNKTFIDRVNGAWEPEKKVKPKRATYPKKGIRDPWYKAWEASRKEEALKKVIICQPNLEKIRREQNFVNAAICIPLKCSKISNFTHIIK